MKKILLTCCRAGLVLMALAWALPAGAATTTVLVPDEPVNASDLPDNAIIVCGEGNCTINMDVDKTFRCIKRLGFSSKDNYMLNIVGDGMLTIKGSNEIAIDCYNLNLKAPYQISGADYGICARNVTISNRTNFAGNGDYIKAKYGAIDATGDIKVEGYLTAEKTSYEKNRGDACIRSYEGNIVLDGYFCAISVTSKKGGRALRADKGSVQLVGKVSVKGEGNENVVNDPESAAVVSCNDFQVLNQSDTNVTITATDKTDGMGIYAIDLSINGPLKVYAARGAVVRPETDLDIKLFKVAYPYCVANAGELSVVRSQGRYVLYDQTNKKVITNMTVEQPEALTGTLTIDQADANGVILPGTTLSVTARGMVKQYLDRGDGVQVRWKLYTNDYYYSMDAINTYTGETYTVKEGDDKRYIRVWVESDIYNTREKACFSQAYLIQKNSIYTAPVKPTLTHNDDYTQVIITNPQPNQEYIVSTSSSGSLLNWFNAWRPVAGATTMALDGTSGATNYVYTRFKETIDTYHGDLVISNSIYLGAIATTQNIKLTPYKAEEVTVGVRKQEFLTSLSVADYNAYYCKMGDVIKITAEPIPADATNFNGILGSKWLDNGKNGTFYADLACTTELVSGTFYKSVYFKPGKQQNYVLLGAELTKGYNDIAYADFYLHVADVNGVTLISSMNAVSVNIERGKTRMEQLQVRPLAASFFSLKTSLTSATGTTGPSIAFSTKGLVKIDATNATAGTYVYDVLQKNKKIEGASITVTVSAIELENLAVYPEEITAAEPGETYQLEATMHPGDATETVTWTSTNTAVATVDANGLVTIADGADIAATAMIIAKAGEIADTCNITIAGEKYNLWVGGVQVTTRNMDEETLSYLVASEAGDEAMERYFNDENRISFDGTTLTLNNVSIETDSENADFYKKRGIYSQHPDLEVRLVGDNRITGYDAIVAWRDITFTGSGSLNCTTSFGLGLYSNSNYATVGTVTDSVDITIDASRTGIYSSTAYKAGILYCESPTATLRVRGNANGSITNMYNIWLGDGVGVLEPAAGVWWNRNYGEAVDANGNVITDWIVFGAKAAGLRGDVTGDGVVDVADINAVINVILAREDENTYGGRADVDQNGTVDVADINTIINAILSR